MGAPLSLTRTTRNFAGLALLDVRGANRSLFVPFGGIYAMADRSNKQADLPAAALVAGLRLTPQMLIMFRLLLSSPQRTKLLLLGVAIVAIIGTTAFGQVMLNA
jgi:hypothetical protein